ncbi:hypothetical protein BJ138DRAFT_1011500 [Hygrophoropsis aurantiaca]|uniref:Uncharacterized protein n=1 Tax=Hygrophoropsis aurantiaca TaxID=72124 RepID=A0ACB8A8S4_9AGAM|nr:hypothetical protein BJ138DRAFT_1011500 [Hygrophoropsis aurantiaca]
MSYAAEFTTPDGDKSHTCEKCLKEFSPNIKLHYMHSAKASQLGRWLCSQCHDYYLSKPTTKRIESSESHTYSLQSAVLVLHNYSSDKYLSHTDPSQSEAHGPEISARLALHQQTAEAQRGGISAPLIYSVFQLIICAQGMSNPVQPVGNLQIATPSFPQAATFPSMLASLQVPTTPGYHQAHTCYKEMRRLLAHQAYAANGVELIVVKAFLMILPPGKKSVTVVSSVRETISNVPVHIGAHDLKTIVYLTLQPIFLKWSHGLPFTFDEVRLRLGKTWEEILPKIVGEDIDAIAAHFFPQNGKGKSKFKPGRPLEVHLELPQKKYQEALDHRLHFDEVDLDATSPSESFVGGQINSPEPPSTPPQKARTLDPVVSPEVNAIRDALRAQFTPLNKGPSALDLRSVASLFYVVPMQSLAEILKSPEAPVIPVGMNPLSVTLIFNPKDKGKWGGFKKALFGHTSPPVLGPDGYACICLKQCFYTAANSTTRHIYDNLRQIRELNGEIKCLKWAIALMRLVYDFIDAELQVRTGMPFEIPQVRFVEAALATTTDQFKGATTYLVEEMIDEKTDGKFVKYISNERAAPRPLADPESVRIADFLAFAQHVQYRKTKKLAFVSDFQGGRTLLTDPQIITAPYVQTLLQVVIFFVQVSSQQRAGFNFCRGKSSCSIFELP